MSEDTPLGRAADALRRELQDYITGLDEGEWDRLSHGLAGDALGAARLPEQLDTASELRTANLLAVARAWPGSAPGSAAYERVLTRLGLPVPEVDRWS